MKKINTNTYKKNILFKKASILIIVMICIFSSITLVSATRLSTTHFSTSQEQRCVLTIHIIGNGSVTPQSGSAFKPGTIIPLFAIPSSGWLFSHWQGDLQGTQNPISLTIQKNMSITAVFVKESQATHKALFISPFDDDSPWRGTVQLFNRVLLSGGFKQEHIITLIDEEATKQNIVDTLTCMVSKLGPADTLLLGIFSHGNQGFFYNSFFDLIYYSEVNDILNQSRSAGIGIIIDACFSGSAIPILSADNRIIATSTNANSWGLGRFGYGMALAFDEIADYCPQSGNNDGVVSFEEAYLCFKDNYPGYASMYEDRYPGELHITYQDWSIGRKDQITYPSIISTTFQKVHQYRQNQQDYFFEVAQSFIPTKDTITQVKLRVEKFGTVTSPLLVSIRSNLTGFDLSSVLVQPEDIAFYERYITIPLNLVVTVNTTYYIVCRTIRQEASPADYYLIRGISNNGSGYPQGMCFIKSHDAQWSPLENVDMMFITYGLNSDGNIPPYTPKRPTGTVLLRVGDIASFLVSTTDVNNDKISYMIDYGDSTNLVWSDLLPSGMTAQFLHSYTQEGIYMVRVKAKDQHGAMSGWSDTLFVIVQPNMRRLSTTMNSINVDSN